MLLKAILKHTDGLDKLNIFVPLVNTELMKIMEALNFERKVYLLALRDDLEVPDYDLPEGYEMRAFRPGKDEEAWCEVEIQLCKSSGK